MIEVVYFAFTSFLGGLAGAVVGVLVSRGNSSVPTQIIMGGRGDDDELKRVAKMMDPYRTIESGGRYDA